MIKQLQAPVSSRALGQPLPAEGRPVSHPRKKAARESAELSSPGAAPQSTEQKVGVGIQRLVGEGDTEVLKTTALKAGIAKVPAVEALLLWLQRFGLRCNLETR